MGLLETPPGDITMIDDYPGGRKAPRMF